MGMLLRLGGEWKTITGAQVYAGSAWRPLVAIQVFAFGAWNKVANFTPPAPAGGGGGGGTMALTASPGFDSVTRTSGTITSDYITATPSGGLAPYTYAWSITASDPGPTYNINLPTNSFTSVTAAGVGPGTDRTCTIQCVATDSLGVSATSNAVTIDFFHDNGGL